MCACVGFCAPRVSGECQVPRIWHLTWVLETKPGSSGETASDLNRWVIFSAPKITFKETEIMLWVTENIVACASPVWVMLILDGSTCFWSPVVQCDSVCCVFLSGPWVWMVSHASQQATIPNYCHLTLGSVLNIQVRWRFTEHLPEIKAMNQISWAAPRTALWSLGFQEAFRQPAWNKTENFLLVSANNQWVCRNAAENHWDNSHFQLEGVRTFHFLLRSQHSLHPP